MDEEDEEAHLENGSHQELHLIPAYEVKGQTNGAVNQGKNQSQVDGIGHDGGGSLHDDPDVIAHEGTQYIYGRVALAFEKQIISCNFRRRGHALHAPKIQEQIPEIDSQPNA